MVVNECGRVQRKAVVTTRDLIGATPDVSGSSVWDLFYIISLEPYFLENLCTPGREPFYTTTSEGIGENRERLQ